MIRSKHIAIVLAAAALCACVKEEISTPGGAAATTVIDNSEFNAVCVIDSRVQQHATKALVDQLTSSQLDANFLRINEEVSSNNAGTYKFMANTPFAAGGNAKSVNWEEAYLCEASIISSSDNTDSIHYRSIVFSPKQVYNLLSNKRSDGSDKIDTTKFYHTRMVGWYPKNCALKDKKASQKFSYSTDQTQTHTIGGRTFKSVKFSGLDGATDVMVSNVCEGQHWHSRSTAGSPYTLDADNLPYRMPFGHYLSYNVGNDTYTQTYSNYFKFRHYLSGVRFWGFVPDQNTHALDMWGKITDVVLLNQPTSVCITLPEEPAYDASSNSLSWSQEQQNFNDPAIWGQAYGWDDYQNFSVQTGPMFGDNSSHSNEAYTVDFNQVNMKGVGDKEHAAYLGYSLVQPNEPVTVEIHTKYGVYVSAIDPHYIYKYTENNVEHSDTLDLFQPGCYYDVYLSLKTDGTISAIIETRGSELYYDLTRSVAVDEYTAQAREQVVTYRYSNCYIVDPAKSIYDKNGDGVCDYSGFFFSGMNPGNGSAGVFTYNSQKFYPESGEISPSSARLIWESSRLLVSEVELINGYVKFRVPGANVSTNFSNGKYTGAKGNAVIGVFDDNDNCLWSWHIWVTDTPEDVTYYYSNDTIKFMDRNLGATYGGVPTDTASARASYGLYYQWGRKDPSMGPATWDYSQENSATAAYYDYASEKHTSSIPLSLPNPSLRDGVENPMYLILPSRKSDKGYNYDWLYFEPENLLWGFNNRTASMSKTIYDPCPFGYRVPSQEITKLMENNTGYTRSTYGLTFTNNVSKSLFFPFAGYKGVDKSLATLTCAWSYVGKKGDYQEATYATSTKDNLLYARKRSYISSESSWVQARVLEQSEYTYGSNITAVNGSYIFSDYTNRRVAASMRCVKDTKFGAVVLSMEPAKPTFNFSESVAITLDASSAESPLQSVTLKVVNKVKNASGVYEPVTTELINLNPGAGVWHNIYTFTAPDEEYLQTSDGIYVFTFTAVNDFGIRNSVTDTLSYKEDNKINMLGAMTIMTGASKSLEASLHYSGTGQTITYSSSNTSVATVNASGTVTGVAPGYAIITAKAAKNGDWSEVSEACAVTVKGQGAIIGMPDSFAVGLGKSKDLEISSNSGATVKYKSSNESVAIVNSAGEVTGVNEGTCTITAWADAYGYYTEAPEVSTTVSVNAIVLKSRTITISGINEIEVGGYTSGSSGTSTTIAPGVTTLTASSSESMDGTLTFEVSDLTKVTQSVSGSTIKLTAKACGTITVRARVTGSETYEDAVSDPFTIKVFTYKLMTEIPSESGEYVISSSNSSSSAYTLESSTTRVYVSSYCTIGENELTGVKRNAVKKLNITTSSSSTTCTIAQYNSQSSYLRIKNQSTLEFSTTNSQNSWTMGANLLSIVYNKTTYNLYLKSSSNFISTTYTWTPSTNYSTPVYFYHRVCE